MIYILISVLPNNGPHISGEQTQYQIGDEINLNCTSGKSSPASVLHWEINEEKVISYPIYYAFMTEAINASSVSNDWILHLIVQLKLIASSPLNSLGNSIFKSIVRQIKIKNQYN